MKVGDMVLYYRPQWANPAGKRPIGIILEIKHYFNSGGGGSFARSENWCAVAWSHRDGVWITEERMENLEEFVDENER